MTERLYYTSDVTEGCAKVVSCTADADGRYAVELDKTLFHPQGGGQPADKGWIADIPVEEVVQRGENVVHILSRSLEPGEVDVRVDAVIRQQHSLWHSAGHLVGYAGEISGWQPVKAHHWPGEGRITFVAKDNDSEPTGAELLAIIQPWLECGLSRSIAFEEGRRKVWFGDLPAYLCGGTHVKTLAEINGLTITAVKIKKGQLIVNYTLA
ncbi:alanyl-tRNA editing protein [Cedecea davisae]|uniref:Alanyl-tRNA editing protein n=1 Tax=Cedecea davisae TaxID=158484 RepID=A0ABS6DFN3_9ENTR|nr:alanyl-tRNA editing protein [Cedecea davisae]MBU4681933.1 alanyl-tRNA editing protein [Cedecea davisae]MBU4686069.1 alanyl-tRNA editing protein [Cedecea davisae]